MLSTLIQRSILFVTLFCFGLQTIGQEIEKEIASLSTSGGKEVHFLGAKDGEYYHLSYKSKALGKASGPFEFITVNESDGNTSKVDLGISDKKVTPQKVVLAYEGEYTLLLSIAAKGTVSLVARTFDSNLQFVSDKVLTTMKSMAYITEYSKYINKFPDLEPVVSDNHRFLAMGFRNQTVVFDAKTKEVVVKDHPAGLNISFNVTNEGQCYAFRMYEAEFRLDLVESGSGSAESIKLPAKSDDMVVSIQKDEAQNIYAVFLKGSGGLWGDYVRYAKTGGATVNTGPFTEAKTRANGYGIYQLGDNKEWTAVASARFEPSIISKITESSEGIEWLTVDNISSSGDDLFVVFQQRHLMERQTISHRTGGIVVVQVDKAGKKEAEQLAVPRQCWTSEARKKYDHTYFKWHKGRPMLAYYQSEKFDNYQFVFHFMDSEGVKAPTSVALDYPHHNIYPGGWNNSKGTSVLTFSPRQNGLSTDVGKLSLP